jgi:hypothetical protein
MEKDEFYVSLGTEFREKMMACIISNAKKV